MTHRPMARPAPPAGVSPPPLWKDILFMVSLGWLVLAVAGGFWLLGGHIRSWLGF